MKRFKIIMIAAFIMSALTVLAQKNTENILFDYDAFTLTKSEQTKLEKLSQLASENNVVSISISGHTDSDGKNTYNDELSKQRAETISKFLTSKDIDKDLIKINYFGENKPVSSNATAEGMQQNRRVEISIEYAVDKTASIPEIEKKTEPLFGEDAVFGSVFDEFDKPAQKLKFDASKGKEIVGEEGTVLKIPKKALTGKGSPDSILEPDLRAF